MLANRQVPRFAAITLSLVDRRITGLAVALRPPRLSPCTRSNRRGGSPADAHTAVNHRAPQPGHLMPVRRSRRRTSEVSTQQIHDHAQALTEANSIYRPSRRRTQDALPAPSPRAPSAGSTELQPWTPRRPDNGISQRTPVDSDRARPSQVAPETAAEMTAPIPTVTSTEAHEHPRGRKQSRPIETGYRDQADRQSQTYGSWTPRPRRVIGGGRHAKPEPEQIGRAHV